MCPSYIRKLLVTGVIISALSAPNADAQQTTTQNSTQTAKASDVSSIDAILCALYGSISGPKGVERDFNRFRSLMAPEARLIFAGRDASGNYALRNWSVDDYVNIAGPNLVASGFYEAEIGRETTSFGSVWHIMSAYDSRRTLADEKPFQRGVNSIQLFNNGNRWYIVSIMWDAERADMPISPTLLNKKPGPCST